LLPFVGESKRESGATTNQWFGSNKRPLCQPCSWRWQSIEIKKSRIFVFMTEKKSRIL